MRKEKLVVFLLLMLNVGILHAQHPACGFSQQEISDSVFSRMYGKSFKAECTTLRSDLRCLRVLHCNVHGETLTGELVCHKDIADDLNIPLGTVKSRIFHMRQKLKIRLKDYL